MKLLLALDARVTNRGGFLLLDLERGTHRWHEHDFAERFARLGFRGMARHGSTIYVLNSAALYRFRLDLASDPLVIHEGTLRRPEWERGERAAADLHHVLYSPRHERLFITSSFLDAIDEVTPDLRWCGRRYLWDLSPELAALALERNPLAADLAHGNHLAEHQGKLYLTLGNLNGTRKGAVLCVDTGELVLDGLDFPHDGVVHEDALYVSNSQTGVLAMYAPLGEYRLRGRAPARAIEVPIRQDAWRAGGHWIRGLAIGRRHLVVGTTQLRADVEGVDADLVPPRLVVFERPALTWAGEVFLPELPGLPNPCIYSIELLDDAGDVPLDLARWPAPTPAGAGGTIVELELPDAGLTALAAPSHASPHWCWTGAREALRLERRGALAVLHLDLPDPQQRAYLLSGAAPATFDKPVVRWKAYRLAAEAHTSLRVDVAELGYLVRAQVYLIEYDAEGRVATHSFILKQGRNVFRLRSHPRARSYRIAVRLSGRGALAIERFQLTQVQPA